MRWARLLSLLDFAARLPTSAGTSPICLVLMLLWGHEQTKIEKAFDDHGDLTEMVIHSMKGDYGGKAVVYSHEISLSIL